MNNFKSQSQSIARDSQKVGYFEVTYCRLDGQHRMVCFMAGGFQDAGEVFAGFGLGELTSVKEIGSDAFFIWYKALIKQMDASGKDGA